MWSVFKKIVKRLFECCLSIMLSRYRTNLTLVNNIYEYIRCFNSKFNHNPLRSLGDKPCELTDFHFIKPMKLCTSSLALKSFSWEHWQAKHGQSLHFAPRRVNSRTSSALGAFQCSRNFLLLVITQCLSVSRNVTLTSSLDWQLNGQTKERPFLGNRGFTVPLLIVTTLEPDSNNSRAEIPVLLWTTYYLDSPWRKTRILSDIF